MRCRISSSDKSVRYDTEYDTLLESFKYSYSFLVMNKGGSLIPRLPGEDLGNEAIKMAGEIVNLRVQGKGKGYLKAPKQQHSLNIHFIKDGNQAPKKGGPSLSIWEWHVIKIFASQKSLDSECIQ